MPRQWGSPSVSSGCLGSSSSTGRFFNEFSLRLPCPAAPVVEALADKGILCGIPASRLYPDRAELANLLLVAATETVTEEDMNRLEQGLRETLS